MELLDLVAAGGAVVLTGAGLSTESGIPDYRGQTGRARPATPMTFQAFTADPDARRRYWARSAAGWPVMRRARPNAGHNAVAALQDLGLLDAVITQNVDGLHTAAGARDVIELHGALARVVCLDCGEITDRGELADRLEDANPGWAAHAGGLKPDGDADLPGAAFEAFVVVDCRRCGGILKPDVVFFGETVPAERVQRCFAAVEAARCLLVLGSSLTVMSGYRFVLRAAKLAIPVAIVNQGPTRGDDKAAVRVDAPLGQVLPSLSAAVQHRARTLTR